MSALGKTTPDPAEPTEAEIWKFDDATLVQNGHRVSRRARSGGGRTSVFASYLATLPVFEGSQFVSHKKWFALASAGRIAPLSAGSVKNGPIYSLRNRYLTSERVNLLGDSLEWLAKSEGVDLTENDIVYRISPMTEEQRALFEAGRAK